MIKVKITLHYQFHHKNCNTKIPPNTNNAISHAIYRRKIIKHRIENLRFVHRYRRVHRLPYKLKFPVKIKTNKKKNQQQEQAFEMYIYKNRPFGIARSGLVSLRIRLRLV
jgi:hypothetical protein